MKKIKIFIAIIVLSQVTFGQKHYPKFSWDKVSVAYHFGKKGNLLTTNEAKFIASKTNFVVLEKAHGFPKYKFSEEAILRDAKVLKKYNNDLKIIFYWNAFLDYSMYQAHKEYEENPDWWLKNADGTLDLKRGRIKRYDLSNPAVRKWWIDVAEKM